MDLGARRGVALLAVVCGLLWGAEARAQSACSTLNNTLITIPGSSSAVTYTAGQSSVTVVITGSTGSGTISFGGSSKPWSGDGTYTVTSSSQFGSTIVQITGGTGNASVTCTTSSSGSGNSGSASSQVASNAAVSIQNAIQNLGIQAQSIVKSVQGSLMPPKSILVGACPTCA